MYSKIAPIALVMAISFPVTSHAGDLWWAVAVGHGRRGVPVAYGAAWNYPTMGEAKKQALVECSKRHDNCSSAMVGKNSCFYIDTWIYNGIRGYFPSRPFPSMDALEEDVRRSFGEAKIVSNWQVVFKKCSGAK